MKNYSWIVEVKNPIKDEVLWRYIDETLEKIANKWEEDTNNTYLNYTKIHNIYHRRNKNDILITVEKVKEKLININLENITNGSVDY